MAKRRKVSAWRFSLLLFQCSPFSSASPAIGGGAPPTVSQSSLQFRWSGGSGRKILLQLAVVDSSSGATRDSLYCVVSDDGEFTVPSGDWSATWPRGQLLYMYVGNVVESPGTLPYNNSEARIAGVYWNIGVGNIP